MIKWVDTAAEVGCPGVVVLWEWRASFTVLSFSTSLSLEKLNFSQNTLQHQCLKRIRKVSTPRSVYHLITERKKGHLIWIQTCRQILWYNMHFDIIPTFKCYVTCSIDVKHIKCLFINVRFGVLIRFRWHHLCKFYKFYCSIAWRKWKERWTAVILCGR